MKLVVVGLGGIARKAYMPLLAYRPETELLFFSKTAATVAAWKKTYRVERGTTRMAELLSWSPDAAFVLTPSETHFDLCHELLEAGVDVLVEKPATLQIDHTRALAQEADDLGRILMVAFNRRYAPLHREARRLWNGRKIGLAVFEKHRTRAYHPTMFDQFIDDSIHQIDMMRYFCGEPEARVTTGRMEEQLVAGAVGITRLASGGHGLLLNELNAASWQERYTLHGDGASMTIDAFSQLSFQSDGEERILREDYAGSWQNALKARGFQGVIDHFLACVESRKQPETTAWDALKTQELVAGMAEATRYR